MLALAQWTNLAVRFILELVLLGAVTAATWQATGPGVVRWTAAVAAPVAVALGWVLVVHGAHVPAPVRAGAQVAALVLGVTCLVRLGAVREAWAVAGVAVVNASLLAAWDQ